uniref:Uncharacterized protein n=1 Tax=Aegilops tauschii TaxID=37682 RepID=M8BN50_AEGTA
MPRGNAGSSSLLALLSCSGDPVPHRMERVTSNFSSWVLTNAHKIERVWGSNICHAFIFKQSSCRTTASSTSCPRSLKRMTQTGATGMVDEVRQAIILGPNKDDESSLVPYYLYDILHLKGNNARRPHQFIESIE